MGISSVVNKLLRAGEGKIVKDLKAIADQINALEPAYVDFENEEFPEYTAELKRRYWGDNWDTYQSFITGEIAFDIDGNEIEGPGTPQVLRDDTPIEPLGESLDDLLPEAFALVREASKRTIGQRHFDVQLMGGAALFKGNISEMKTGEGKTLVATLPSYLAAIAGLGVHVITVNDYLASYQGELMGRIHRFLGLSIGCIVSNQTPDIRRQQYNADITYGTNNEFGFDYLRDNMAMSIEGLVQRGHFFAIVDEVDSILIDEARTPLIISGRAGGDLNAQYQDFARFVKTLEKDTDYEVDEKKKTVGVLEPAIEKLERHLGLENLYDAVNTPLIQFMQNAIRAKELFIRDKDYIVTSGEVKIVDEHTGRVLDGRRYNEGMHQAIEAKEGVKIQEENQTFATITLQNYFRLYKKLSGMTGTAETEAAEFLGTYKLGVVPIPTNKPMQRIDQKDYVYRSTAGKYMAIVEDVKERFEAGQPVLIGTVSVEKSEEISEALKRNGIPHNVLNAKQHQREATVVAMAGRKGAVTVATNMAGRGTDIMLGGNSEFLAREDMLALGLDPVEDAATYEKKWPSVLEAAKRRVEDEHDEVVALGGLYVLGTERHESRRIDNQLRGRAGRQGDPGESRFYISMEDDLMRLFNSGRAQQIMAMTNFPEDQPIESKMLSNSIQSAQAQVEGRNFEMRKNVLKYDDVMNRQRTVMYKERKRILLGENVSGSITSFIDSVLESVVREDTMIGSPEEWDLDKLWRELKSFYPISISVSDMTESVGGVGSLTAENIIDEVISDAKIRYAERADFIGAPQMRNIERQIMLSVLDRRWRNHLYEMDYLKEGIGLRAMAQKDPLVEYTNEGSSMFYAMNQGIREDVVRSLFHISIALDDGSGKVRQLNVDNTITVTEVSGPSEEGGASSGSDEMKQAAKTRPNNGQAVSAKKQAIKANQEGDNPYAGTPKNSPCPCGSGKKYKLCHGRGE